jgi:Na+/H+ antiporter NhaD/arsenite permease-like protein
MYLYFYLMLTLLSILLGNDPVILSGTAFLVYYTEVAKLDPRAWIMAEFAAANTASMVLFVGNPTNVCISHINKNHALSEVHAQGGHM